MITADTDATPIVSGHDADARLQGGAARGEWIGPAVNDSDTYQAALAYQARGWSLVALHWITAAGQCSCGRPGCKSAGKHPIDYGWQKVSSDPAQRWAPGTAGAIANIGHRTGTASGFWVLDFDPADADEAGDALFDRMLDAGIGAHVRTGSGGFHYRFALPDFVVRNRQSAGGGAGRTHGLPMGWDVRGEGGQVVAPPSVSAKGPYVELNAGVHVPPGWVLDMIRPQERSDPPNHTVSTESTAGLFPGGNGAIAGGAGEGSSHSADRIQAYCNKALGDELSKYEQTADGRRGNPAFNFGCNLVEVANLAGWSLDAVYPYFEASALRAGANAGGGGYLPHELPGQWQRAIEHVGGRCREMPPGPDVLPGFTPPFVGAGVAPAHDLRIVEPGDVPPGATGQETAPMLGPDLPLDGWTRDLRRAVYAQDVREAAEQFRRERDAAGRPSLASRVLTGDTLDSVPDPVPLIEGWLFMDSTARINGRPGQGKSFVAADLLCSVATGTMWAGLPVRQGPVLAVVAEGVSGFKLRIRAWESDRDRRVGAALHLVPFPVQTLDDVGWSELITYAAAVRPALITLDTQARMSVGARENDAADMGRVLDAVERLRAATGACVVLVHHATKTGDSEGGRGSNAMEGGVVSEFFVSKSGHVVTVKTTRQKDIESDAKVTFSLKPVDKSAVLTTQLSIVEPTGEMWKTEAIGLYEILRTEKLNGLTWAELFKAAKESATFYGKRTTFISQAWNNLLVRGLVVHGINPGDRAKFSVHVREEHGDTGVLTPNVGEWTVTDPDGWQTYRPDLIKDDADFTVNLGKAGRLDSSKRTSTPGK